MDERIFDELTKTVSSATPRRAALKTIAAGVIGAVSVAVGLGEAEAAARKRAAGVVCSKNADCLGSVCLPKDQTGRRTCGCEDPLVVCNGVCRSPFLGSCNVDADCCTGFCYDGTCYSCFIAGTRIAMADGTSRNIEDVREGDAVLGAKGQANRVIGIELPLLGARSLYSFNGGRAFVTSEHPFATETGWKSIDPTATARENAALAVRRLVVGDRMLALAAVRVPAFAGGAAGAGPLDVQLEPVILDRLERGAADPGTQLYNLLLDGDHAYFADDWLAHNKG